MRLIRLLIYCAESIKLLLEKVFLKNRGKLCFIYIHGLRQNDRSDPVTLIPLSVSLKWLSFLVSVLGPLVYPHRILFLPHLTVQLEASNLDAFA
jgi:hypothetical protein